MNQNADRKTGGFLVAALLAAAVSGIVLACDRSVAFRDFEFWGYDFLVNHGGYTSTSRRIVIVDFDDATFASLRQYPVPRSIFAEVIARVAAGGARIVGLDLFISEPRSPMEDSAMREALAKAGNVIVASQAAAGGIPRLMPLGLFCVPEDPESASGFCKDGTAENTAAGALGYAFVNLPVESDGFVRRLFLFSTGPHAGVSFSAMLAQQYAGEPLKPLRPSAASFLGKPIPYADPNDRSVLIGTWNRVIARRISAIDLLQNPASFANDFRDKLVLIGQTSDAARDRLLTPVFRPEPKNGPRLRLAGIEVHAAAIETLLSGTPARTCTPATTWILLFLTSGLTALLVLRLQLGPAALGVGVLLLLLYGTAQSLFAWDHLWLRYATLAFGSLLSVPAGLGYRFVQEKLLHTAVAKEREQIMGLFGRYVSPEVAQQIWLRRDEVVLAGEERVATVLFSDIRGFTATTAGKPSRAVLQWLNEYLTGMDELIRMHGGFLNKFIGDGIMVLYGVPLSAGVEKDAVRAVRSALAMIERVARMNNEYPGQAGFPPLKIGIGIHTGKLTCGNVGSKNRLEYSVIGETVNLASRLESLTKDFGTGIVMSEATAAAVREEFSNIRELGEAQVRGFPERVRLYTIS